MPGIWNTDQIAAWKKTTTAVHAKGSFIYMQLWALGRTARPDVLKRECGREVMSASSLAFEGGPTPTPMTEEEIWEFIGLYKQAALNAMAAGFDGVEVHCANGYLIDQFLQDVSNTRTDEWGGSVEKRARFGLEVVKAVIDAVGAERTAIRLSPFSTFMSMKMADPREQFSYYVGELKKLKLSYLHLIEPRIAGYLDVEASEKNDFLVELWGKTSPVFLAGGYNMESAYKAVDEEHKVSDVAIVFGRWFTSNPDLVFRLKNRLELTQYDRSKLYNPKEEDGYTTWSFSEEFERSGLREATAQIA